jgi:hypothetical protein
MAYPNGTRLMLSSFATLLLAGSIAGVIFFKVWMVDIGAIVVLILACSQGSKSKRAIMWLKVFMVVYVIGLAAIFAAAAVKAPGLKAGAAPFGEQAMLWAMLCAGTVSVWAAINFILLLKVKEETHG